MPAARGLLQFGETEGGARMGPDAVQRLEDQLAIRELEHAAEAGKQLFVKLLHPQPRVSTVLDQTGLLPFYDVHTDEAAALASF